MNSKLYSILTLLVVGSMASCLNTDHHDKNNPSLDQISTISQVPENPHIKRVNTSPQNNPTAANASDSNTIPDEDVYADNYQEKIYQKRIPTKKPKTFKALEGVYIDGGQEESWVMTVKVNGNNVMATLYELRGTLPEDGSYFNGKKGDFKANIIESHQLKSFDVNLDDLTFHSELGPGDLTGNHMIFLRYYDDKDKPLELFRDESFDVLLKNY